MKGRVRVHVHEYTMCICRAYTWEKEVLGKRRHYLVLRLRPEWNCWPSGRVSRILFEKKTKQISVFTCCNEEGADAQLRHHDRWAGARFCEGTLDAFTNNDTRTVNAPLYTQVTYTGNGAAVYLENRQQSLKFENSRSGNVSFLTQVTTKCMQRRSNAEKVPGNSA